jgi:hypothetical protein
MVLKAVRGIGSEIESLALAHRTGADNDDVWIATGQKVCDAYLQVFWLSLIVLEALLFRFDSPKMILALSDATESLELGENEEEALNEVIHQCNCRWT